MRAITSASEGVPVANPVVDAARRALGPVGACLPVSFTSNPRADLQRKAVGRLERAGYSAVWANEVIGKDALVQLAVLLSATERMVFGTCIANIWARPAQTMHAAAAQLAQAYPGRFVLGLGVGYPEQAASVGHEFGSPLATMRDYLDRMGSPTWPPAPDAPYPRIIAANGPKMLALAGDIADGALPAMVPTEFTAQARRVLGPDKLLVVGLSIVVDADADRAKSTAQEAVPARLDSTAIATEMRQHLAAGADHVTLLLPIGGDFTSGIEQLEQLAPVLAAGPG
jgi:probable F420-dependent oxidoreductase